MVVASSSILVSNSRGRASPRRARSCTLHASCAPAPAARAWTFAGGLFGLAPVGTFSEAGWRGGGSGGAIVVDAPVVSFGSGAELHADGGNGGSGGGGGGSAGTVFVSGALLGGFESVDATVAGGSGGGGDVGCPMGGGDPTSLDTPEVKVDHSARSTALALGEFWQSIYAPDDASDADLDPQDVGIQIPLVATAAPHLDGLGGPYAPGNPVGYQVVLCHASYPPDASGYATLARYQMPSVDSDWRAQPCGSTDFDGNGTGDTTVYEKDQTVDVTAASGEVLAADGLTFDVSPSSGYHAYSTRAFVTSAAGNDCFSLDLWGDPNNPTPVTDESQQPSALAFDTTFCAAAEPLSPWLQGSPEITFGVDNDGPNVTITPVVDPSHIADGTAYTNFKVLRAVVTANDFESDVELSGIASDGVVCYFDVDLDFEVADLAKATKCDDPGLAWPVRSRQRDATHRPRDGPARQPRGRLGRGPVRRRGAGRDDRAAAEDGLDPARERLVLAVAQLPDLRLRRRAERQRTAESSRHVRVPRRRRPDPSLQPR